MKWINRFGLDRPTKDISFKTTDIEKKQLPRIRDAMLKSGISNVFVDDAVSIASDDHGVFDLMKMWLDSKSSNEQEKIVKDIQSIIDSHKK